MKDCLTPQWKHTCTGGGLAQYTLAITDAGRRGRWDLALEMYQEISHSGAEPNTISCGASLGALDRSARWEQAVRFLNDARCSRLRPNVFALSSVVSSCSRTARRKRAMILIEEGRQDALEIDVVLWSSVIGAAERASEWETAVGFLAAARISRLRPDTVSYSASLASCATCECWNIALQLLLRSHGEMGRIGGDAFRSVLHAAAGACTRAAQWATALGIVKEVCESGVRSSLYTYHLAAGAADASRRWVTALEVLGTMVLSGVLPNVVTSSAAIKACGSGQFWEASVCFFEALARAALRPNAVTCNTLLSTCGGGEGWGPNVQALFVDMRGGVIEPDVVTYGAAMDACASLQQADSWAQAVAFFCELRACGMVVGAVHWTAAMAACRAGGHWARAAGLAEEMLGLSVPLNDISLNAAIAACGARWTWAVDRFHRSRGRYQASEQRIQGRWAALEAAAKARQGSQALALLTGAKDASLFLDPAACEATCRALVHPCEAEEHLASSLPGDVRRAHTFVAVRGVLADVCKQTKERLRNLGRFIPLSQNGTMIRMHT